MSVILFFVVLVVLIVVHELGHFLAAKLAGIRVDEFGLGFPPKLFGRRLGETEYSINALPFGGFVKIFGENLNDESQNGPDRARSFVHKQKWVQAAVLVAGVFCNLLLAWGLFTLGFMLGMPTSVEEAKGRVLTDVRLVATSILPDSPAASAGIKIGDRLRSLSESGEVIELKSPEDVSAFISSHGEKLVAIQIERGGKLETLMVEPKAGVIQSAPETPAIGIAMGVVGDLRLPLTAAFIEGAKFTWHLLISTVVGLYHPIVQVFTGAGDFSQVTGPVGLVGLVGDATALGFVYLLTFVGIISVNLAVINLLPFPALDGGRLLFVVIEKLKGSPLRPSFANTLNAIGFALLILLMLAVTYKDVAKLVAS